MRVGILKVDASNSAMDCLCGKINEQLKNGEDLALVLNKYSDYCIFDIDKGDIIVIKNMRTNYKKVKKERK